MVTPFVTRDELKAYLNVADGVTAYDDRIDALVLEASRMIETFARRKFAKAQRTEYFHTAKNHNAALNFLDHGDGTTTEVHPRTLTLGGIPVDTGAEFKVYYDSARAFEETALVESSKYFLDAETGKLTLLFQMNTHPRSLKVVYTAGYEASGGTLSDNAPGDLKHACVLQALHLWNKSSPENAGFSSDDEDGEPRDFGGSDLYIPEMKSLVRPYRRLLTGGSYV